MRRNTHKESSRFVPNHHNDPIKDVVWILNVAKRTINKDFQQHLQGKEACEDDVADLQGVGQLVWLWAEKQRGQRKWERMFLLQRFVLLLKSHGEKEMSEGTADIPPRSLYNFWDHRIPAQFWSSLEKNSKPNQNNSS